MFQPINLKTRIPLVFSLSVLMLAATMFVTQVFASASVQFITPASGSTLNGKTQIEVASADASSVSIYLTRSGTSSNTLLGQARRGSSGNWILEWDMSAVASGEVELQAKALDSHNNVLPSASVNVSVIGLPKTTPVSAPVTKPTPPAPVTAAIIPSIPLTLNHTNSLQAIASPVLHQITLAQSSIPNAAALQSVPVSDHLYPTGLSIGRFAPSGGVTSWDYETAIAGHGPANAKVELHVYSEPIVVSTTTNAQGDFVYHFDQSLPAGDHEIYIAVADSAGQSTERSNIFTFVVGAAVASDYPTTALNAVTDNDQMLLWNYVAVTLGIIAVVGIGFLLAKKLLFKSPK